MRVTCGAIAKSTLAQCRLRAIPGSKYCLFHVEHLPLLYGAIVVALLGLALSLAWSRVVPSAESRQLKDAQTEVLNLRRQVRGVSEQLNKEETRAEARATEQTAQLQAEQARAEARSLELTGHIARLEARLDPFLQLASSRFPKLPEDDALAKLRAELDNVRKLASPPTISFDRVIPGPGDGYSLSILFKKDKPDPIGTVEFAIAITADSTAVIREISPGQVAMSTRPWVAPDGRTAGLRYDIAGSEPPAINVTFSGPTAFEIVGSHGLESIRWQPN